MKKVLRRALACIAVTAPAYWGSTLISYWASPYPGALHTMIVNGICWLIGTTGFVTWMIGRYLCRSW